MSTTTYTMSGGLDLGPVELTVANLDRSLAFYTSSIGLQVLAQSSGSAQLGPAGRPLAVLQEIPGAPPAPPLRPRPQSLRSACSEPSRSGPVRQALHRPGTRCRSPRAR